MIVQPHDLLTDCFEAAAILDGLTVIDGVPMLPIGEPFPEWISEVCWPQCHHGLSLSLCSDPINHYPADNYY